MTLIVGLVLLGLVLISFEIIVPGGVLGFLGAASLIAACAVAYDVYGGLGMIGIFLGSLVLVSVMLVLELKFLPKTKIGQRMFLKSSVEEKSTHEQGEASIVGERGVAVTKLAPTGKIELGGHSYEAFSEDGLIHEGEAVTVVSRDNFRIVVRKFSEQ